MDALITAIHEYYIFEGQSPGNPVYNIGCTVGEKYDGYKNTCLQELVDNGYLKSLPTYDGSSGDYYISYFNYGPYTMIESHLDPQEYGPWPNGWNCSDIVGEGWWDAMKNDDGKNDLSPGDNKEYCMGFFND